MKILTKLFITFFVLSTSFLFSQEMLSLEEAINIALKNNFSISVARNEAVIADNNLTAGNAGLLPKIDINATQSYSINNTKQELLSGQAIDRTGAKSNSFNAGVSLNWTIFQGLALFITYDRLKELRDIGEINFKAEVERTIASVKIVYYDVVKETITLKVIQEGIKISEERLRIAEDKLEVGAGAGVDVLQAKVDLNADKSTLLRQQLIINNLKTSLNQLLGREVNAEFITIDSLVLVTNLDYNDLLHSIHKQNSSLLLSEKNKNISSLMLSGLKSLRFPRISAFVNYNYLYSESQAGFTLSNQNLGFTYGLTLSLNLFDGFNQNRQIENANITLINSELQYKDTKSKIMSEFERQYKAYQNNLTLLKLEEENFEIAERNIDIAMERFRLGTYSPLELREAQRAYTAAQNRLVDAQYQSKVAEIELLKISGLLVKE